MADPQRGRYDSAPDGLRVTHRRVDAALIIAVVGEIDLMTAPTLQEAVHLALEDPATTVCIVDLTEVAYLGSAGLAALVEATDHARHRREPLRIVVDSNQPVIRPIQVTGLDHLLMLYHSVDEALHAGHNPTSQ